MDVTSKETKHGRVFVIKPAERDSMPLGDAIESVSGFPWTANAFNGNLKTGYVIISKNISVDSDRDVNALKWLLLNTMVVYTQEPYLLSESAIYRFAQNPPKTTNRVSIGFAQICGMSGISTTDLMDQWKESHQLTEQDITVLKELGYY